MPRAMSIIQPHTPQGSTGKRIQRQSGSLFRKHGRVQGDVSLEHTCVAEPLVGCGCAEMHGSGDVGGATVVLAATVDEEEGVGVNGAACVFLSSVVDDGPIGVGTCVCVCGGG